MLEASLDTRSAAFGHVRSWSKGWTRGSCRAFLNLLSFSFSKLEDSVEAATDASAAALAVEQRKVAELERETARLTQELDESQLQVGLAGYFACQRICCQRLICVPFSLQAVAKHEAAVLLQQQLTSYEREVSSEIENLFSPLCFGSLIRLAFELAAAYTERSDDTSAAEPAAGGSQCPRASAALWSLARRAAVALGLEPERPGAHPVGSETGPDFAFHFTLVLTWPPFSAVSNSALLDLYNLRISGAMESIALYKVGVVN